MGYQDKDPRQGISRRRLLAGGGAAGAAFLFFGRVAHAEPSSPAPDIPRPITLPKMVIPLGLASLPQSEMVLTGKGQIVRFFEDNKIPWKYSIEPMGSLVLAKGDDAAIDDVQQETHTQKPTYTVYIAEIMPKPGVNRTKNPVAAVLVPQIPSDADIIYRRYTREATQSQDSIIPSTSPAEAER